MIKCEVEVCGKITRAASVSQTHEGQDFLTFNMSVPIKGRDGSSMDLDIAVSCDGDKGSKGVYSVGRTVLVVGTMTIRKRGGKTYYNLRATAGAELCKSSSEKKINGTMEFLGKTGKKPVEEKQDKKGNLFKTFAAFSSDKDGDNSEFTWVHFLYFNPKDGEDFLRESTYIKVSGTLQLGVYKDNVSLDCLVDTVEPWVLPSKKA